MVMYDFRVLLTFSNLVYSKWRCIHFCLAAYHLEFRCFEFSNRRCKSGIVLFCLL